MTMGHYFKLVRFFCTAYPSKPVFIFYIWRVNTKWYIPILLITLAGFGLIGVPATVHNQEIVVQFQEEVSSLEAQKALVRIKYQLETIGVEDLQVVVSAQGDLKITYYSNTEVSRIKALLASENEVAVSEQTSENGSAPFEFPTSNKYNSYKLDVTEIQNDSSGVSGFNGCTVDLKSESDRFGIPHVKLLLPEIHSKEKEALEEVAFLNYAKAALFIESNSRIIPEVRAGPQA